MRLDIRPFRQILSFAALTLLGACGSSGDVAGGTVGTEAGNAVVFQLRLEDGSPATGALAILRPADAIDSSTAPSWQVREADAAGRVQLSIPSGSWTLETRSGKCARRRNLTGDGPLAFLDTLKPLRSLDGQFPGAPAGTWIALPGLARRTQIDATGKWHFDEVPEGDGSLSYAQRRWPLPDSSRTGLVLADSGKVLTQGHQLAIAASARLSRIWLPDSLAPDSARFLDAQGNVVPASVGTTSNGMRSVWAAAFKDIQTVGRSTSPSPSPFQADPSLQLAWIPDLGEGNLIPGASSLQSTGQHPATTASEGHIQTVPLGLSLGTLDAGLLPDTGAFSILLRNRLAATGLGSLWLLSWADTSSDGRLEIGIGSQRLVVRTPGWDTSITMSDSGAWTSWAVSWDGKALTIGVDGSQVLLRMDARLQDRRNWNRRQIGLGGGMEFSAILSWNRSQDVAALSRSISARP